MQTTFEEIINNYKNKFETKWNLKLHSYPEETMFWASRNNDFNDVAMFVSLEGDKYIYVNKEHLDQECFDNFCEVIIEYLMIKSTVNTAKERNSNLTEQELINGYYITKQVFPRF